MYIVKRPVFHISVVAEKKTFAQEDIIYILHITEFLYASIYNIFYEKF